jgi:hypothetical protein
MNSISIIFAFWPFANAWMLIWGVSAAVPIIIHLWNRRRYNEVTWAAMEYLLAALRKHSRRIQIEQWILLAIRTLILLLFALALADPVMWLLPSLGSSLGAAGNTHLVLVIDGSYSMEYRDREQSRFAMAQQLASQFVRQSAQGDGFTLILMADPPEVIVREPAFDPDDIVEEIGGLRTRHTGATLAATLAEINDVVGHAAEIHPRLDRATVYFFSDLGRTTWDAVDSAACRSQLANLGQQCTFVLFDVGNADPSNVALTRLAANEPLVTYNQPVRFDATVEVTSGEVGDRRKVRFFVDGREVYQDDVDLNSATRAEASFVHRFETPGEHTVEGRLDDDPLAVDNHRWLSVPVRESIQVLCVRGKPGSARHVALALEPAKTDRPRVQVDIEQETAVLERELHQFDCLVLCNVAQFSGDEAGVLQKYLRHGGGVIVFLGDQVRPESYNQQLGGSNTAGRILPAKIGAIVRGEGFAFDPLEYRHPIVAPFEGHVRAGLLTTPVWRYYQLEPYDNDAARIALSFHTGDPAIVEEQIGRGRVILVATDPSPDSVDATANPPEPWTAMSTWPSFPPLAQEMLRLAIGGQIQHRNLVVGEAMQGIVRNAAAELTLLIVAPDDREERVPFIAAGEDSQWTFTQTKTSGIYRAEFGPPTSTSEFYAANVDTRESNLERFDVELLPSQIRQDFRAGEHDRARFSVHKPSDLFRYLLFGVFGLLLAESFFAWRFGSGTRR